MAKRFRIKFGNVLGSPKYVGIENRSIFTLFSQNDKGNILLDLAPAYATGRCIHHYAETIRIESAGFVIDANGGFRAEGGGLKISWATIQHPMLGSCQR